MRPLDIVHPAFSDSYNNLAEEARAAALRAKAEPLESAIQSIREIREAGSNGITLATLKENAPEDKKKALGLIAGINRKLKGLRAIQHAIDDLKAKPDTDPDKARDLDHQEKRKLFLLSKLDPEVITLYHTLRTGQNPQESFVNPAKGVTLINEVTSLVWAIDAFKKSPADFQEQIDEGNTWTSWGGPYGIHSITLENDSPEGLKRVQMGIDNADAHLHEMEKMLAELKTLRAKPSDPSTTKELAEINNKLRALREKLRQEVLDLIKSLKSPHLHPFFADADEERNLIDKINGLRAALNSRHFGEGRWENWVSNPTINDPKWMTVLADIETSRKKASNPENCIILSYDPKKGFFSKEVPDTNLNLKDIFRVVDIMKNARDYIALWKRKLEELKKDPHNPELQKYAKFEALLKHLETCEQKGFTGQNTNVVTKDYFGDGWTIHCKTPERKDATLHTMVLMSAIIKEEKKENKAAFAAELLDQPELDNTENLDDAVNNSPKPQ